MAQLTLTIDGKPLVAEEGKSVLEAALANGIYIPHLCYHPELAPSGACRMCLVEIEGELVTSCRVPVKEGLAVSTSSPEVERARRALVEMLIACYHNECRGCPATGHCELQRIMAYTKVNVKRMRPLRIAEKREPLDTSHPCFDYDPNRCILCGICVKTCASIPGKGIINFIGRGHTARVAFFGDTSQCESCKECVTRCPVKALVLQEKAPVQG
ncbi:MAG: 2Fe-2S iron-sulfur cluster-binding protein [Chloroflexota bacterium]